MIIVIDFIIYNVMYHVSQPQTCPNIQYSHLPVMGHSVPQVTFHEFQSAKTPLSFTASNWHDNEQKEKDPDVRESHLLCPFDGVRPFIRFNLLRLHHDTTILMCEMQ